MTKLRAVSVNVVVQDVEAATGFLDALQVGLEPTPPDWAPHHRNVDTAEARVDVDLDSPAFARWWGGVSDDGSVPDVVVNIRVDERDDVDRLHERALELGATELKSPWDAFWGSRYSVVLAPGPLCVGLMGPLDPSRRAAPPAVSDFA